MNILLVYAKYCCATATHCEKALRKEHNVEVFDLLKTPNFISRYINFLIPRGKPVSILKVLKNCLNKPDLIIEIDSDKRHLLDYRKVDIPTAYWAIDSHRKLKFQKLIAKDFDYIFVAQKDYLQYFKDITNNVFWLPLASDPDVFKKFTLPKIFDLGFVGSKDPKNFPDRVNLINNLSKKYSMLAVDNLWKENVGKVYSLSKIGFNKSIGGDLNMRVFEIMSSGTMLLTDKINNGILDLFQEGKHLVFYQNLKDLKEKVDYYLINENEREMIACEGRKEVLLKHTYEQRMNFIINKCLR